MPPSIYKIGRNARNYPSARPYVRADNFWLNAVFPSFNFSMLGGTSSLSITFNNFEANFEIASNGFNIVFPVNDISFEALSGTISSFDISFPLFTNSFSADNISLDAYAISISSKGLIRQIPTISVAAEITDILLDGTVTGSVTIVSPDDSSSGYVFSGEEYIVLNLKTGAHSEYRDGNNNSIATTGDLSFSSAFMKNVSDMYLLSRSDDDISVIVNNGENTERFIDVTFNADDAGNLKNKKVRLAKGLKSNNWSFAVLAPDGANFEVRSIELIVNKTKRRV